MDYDAKQTFYRLRKNLTRLMNTCFNVSTIDDSESRASRYFVINFDTSLASALTLINPSSVRISITDNDGECVLLKWLRAQEWR